MSRNMKNERIGEIGYNNFGSKMIIIDMTDSNHITIFFPEYNYTVYNKKYAHFKDGKIKCSYEKRYFNIGYIGVGKYKGDKNKCMSEWYSMLERCYDPYFLDKYPTYRDVVVCNEWHNFQNFAKWYYKNYYEIENQRMHLDKDILIKGNKIYSPDTCIFVPQRINTLIIKSDNIQATRHYDNRNKIYSSTIRMDGKRYSKGFYTLIEAKEYYKKIKEDYIKQVAEEYKDLIPQKLYEALCEWNVAI